MAVDIERQLLFIAELGNDSVGIVDLEAGKVARRLAGLSEPQGVGWHAPTGTLYVANAGDGSVRLFQAPDFHASRADRAGRRRRQHPRSMRGATGIVVGYGKGALAIIDPASRRKVGEVPLRAIPKASSSTSRGGRDLRQRAGRAADRRGRCRRRAADRQPRSRRRAVQLSDGARCRCPSPDRVARSPAQLLVFATGDGKAMASPATCGDADDVFVDSARKRLYVVCGEGAVDVFNRTERRLCACARVPTAAGARTGLFVPATGRLYVAVRAGSGAVASLWVFRAGP